MHITPVTTYAVRSMVYLKDNADKVVTLKAIAAGTVIPSPFLSKILQNLVRHGYLNSVKGKKGGFKLARPADNISVYDILRATSRGRLLKTPCHNGERKCEAYAACKLRGVWKDLDGLASVYLRSRTLAQL